MDYSNIQLTCHIIGTKNRKRMYIVNPTSIDGNTVYKDMYIPTSWVDKDSGVRTVIDWDYHDQVYLEFPYDRVEPAMLIETIGTVGYGTSLIKHRLVDGVDKRYIELEQTYIIKFPSWLAWALKKKYSKVKPKTTDVFSNVHSHYNIIDDVAEQSFATQTLQERPQADELISPVKLHQVSKQYKLEFDKYVKRNASS